jgi:hypothetical protein
MQMRKRHWLVLLLLAIVVAASGAAALLFRQRSLDFKPEQSDRIRAGMTRAEVEALLGGPPGDYATGYTELRVLRARKGLGRGGPEDTYELWLGDSGAIWVFFDTSNTVSGRLYEGQVKIERGWLSAFFWQMGHYRRRVFPETTLRPPAALND